MALVPGGPSRVWDSLGLSVARRLRSAKRPGRPRRAERRVEFAYGASYCQDVSYESMLPRSSHRGSARKKEVFVAHFVLDIEAPM